MHRTVLSSTRQNHGRAALGCSPMQNLAHVFFFSFLIFLKKGLASGFVTTVHISEDEKIHSDISTSLGHTSHEPNAKFSSRFPKKKISWWLCHGNSTLWERKDSQWHFNIFRPYLWWAQCKIGGTLASAQGGNSPFICPPTPWMVMDLTRPVKRLSQVLAHIRNPPRAKPTQIANAYQN